MDGRNLGIKRVIFYKKQKFPPSFLQDDGPARSGQDDYDAKLQAAIKAAKLNGSARKGRK